MTEVDQFPRTDDHLDRVISQALQEAPVRVRPVPLPDGDQLWLKRVQGESHRQWQRKGDMRRALRREREGLARMEEAGLPVVPLLAGDTDWLVTRDAGPNLRHLLRSSDVCSRERLAAFEAAGVSLARLHRAGFTHGRPTVRAICWDGGQARFLSLSRYAERRRQRHFALDVLIFIHSCLVADRSSHEALGAALGAYMTHAPEGTWPMVRRLAVVLRLVLPATAPFRLARPGSRQLNALPLALAVVAGRDG